MSDPYFDAAKKVREIYVTGYAFPAWVLDHWDVHDFKSTTILYHADDSLDKVKLLATQREPCNIAMRRLYDENAMEAAFGWKVGAYSQTTAAEPMPNFGVLCHAQVMLNSRRVQTWVLNLIGIAHDSPMQPDFAAYRGKDAVLAVYRRIWTLAVAAINMLYDQGHIDTVKVYNVGGGVFRGYTFNDFVTECFEPTFFSVAKHIRPGVKVQGYDTRTKQFNGGAIPDVLAQEDPSRTLYINAWDPWSLIGNGNEYDRSLDGSWGRCSNLAVLGWPVTNPHIRYVRVRT